jgi:hypothetical protein
MPGTNAGTGYPLTFRCAKCKVGHWGRAQRGDHTHEGLNYVVLERKPSEARGLLARMDRHAKYRYRCNDCRHEGWTRHDLAARKWNAQQKAAA